MIGRSILNSRFDCEIVKEVELGNRKAIIPSIRGRAWITGSHLLDLKPPFDINDLEVLPELRALEVKTSQPVIFSENLYHAGYPGTNMKQQRRTLFFSYEPSHHADWVVSLSDEFIEGCTPRQKRLLHRPGHWQENWQQELNAATQLK